ncbi:MAG: YkgJ family cysteine cluster protein [Sphingomonadaceae bacterium]|nr:YkgJ family cysteine cluster protein [Sphingomonadaceae bacterium]
MNRAERRRQAREDRERIARGLEAGRADGREVIALMRVLHDLIEEARDAGTVAPVMQFLHANMRSAERLAPNHLLACRRGCAFCCHTFVSARAPELLFVKGAIPGRDRAAAAAAVEEAWRVTGTLGPGARGGLARACPMLRDGACNVYAARPMTCRMAVSQSAEACGRAFAPGAGPMQIPVPDHYPTLRRGYSIALAGALRRAGFPAWSYEFNAGMRTALARPDAEKAWLAGEDVFADVQRDPGSDPFTLPSNLRLYDDAFA